MKTRFRLLKPNLRGGTLYCKDTVTGERTSLKTKDEDEALQIILAKAHLAGSDSSIDTKQGKTGDRGGCWGCRGHQRA